MTQEGVCVQLVVRVMLSKIVGSLILHSGCSFYLALARHKGFQICLSNDRVLASSGSCAANVALISYSLGVFTLELLLGPLVAARN
jgi:hypothetical protein